MPSCASSTYHILRTICCTTTADDFNLFTTRHPLTQVIFQTVQISDVIKRKKELAMGGRRVTAKTEHHVEQPSASVDDISAVNSIAGKGKGKAPARFDDNNMSFRDAAAGSGAGPVSPPQHEAPTSTPTPPTSSGSSVHGPEQLDNSTTYCSSFNVFTAQSTAPLRSVHS